MKGANYDVNPLVRHFDEIFWTVLIFAVLHLGSWIWDALHPGICELCP